MTVTASPRPTRRRGKRPSRGARRFGYVIGAVLNATLLYLVNKSPGWDALPFLTSDTTLVLTAVNASLVAGLVANLVYVVTDPRWLRALGDAVTAGFGMVAVLRLWVVFPFDLSGSGFDWTWVARVLLALGIVGCAIAAVTGLVAAVRTVERPD